MEIKANDVWVEDLALQVTALRIAMATVIAASPQLTESIRQAAQGIEGVLLPSQFSDSQIARVRQVLERLGQ